jgi:hypothetical protein
MGPGAGDDPGALPPADVLAPWQGADEGIRTTARLSEPSKLDSVPAIPE